MKTVLVIILLFLISGCATTCEPVIETIEVKVPVVVVPKPPVIERPVLQSGKDPIDSDDYGAFVKQLKQDMHNLKSYADRQQEIIDEYNRMSTP